MRDAAFVRSTDAIEEVRAAVTDFRRRAGAAIGEATTEMQRMQQWLESDRPSHWRGEVRRRSERLQHARAELSRVLMGSGGESSAREQRAIVARCQAAAEEAQQKLALSSRWAREMDRQSVLLRGGIASLSQSVDAALPRAEAQLVELVRLVEAYVRTNPDAPRPPQTANDDPPPGSGPSFEKEPSDP